MVLLSSIYLLYLAYSFWSFNGDLLQTQAPNTVNETIFSYRDGLLITLSNPKTISFYLAIVPAIFGAYSLKDQTFALMIITVLTLTVIGGFYVFFSFAKIHILKKNSH